jgi:hypothetical protein
VHDGGLEVDLVPLQRQRLALAHAGGDGHDVERPARVVLRRGEQRRDLRLRQVLGLALVRPRRVDKRGGVAVHQVPALGGAQCPPQDGAGAGDGARRQPSRLELLLHGEDLLGPSRLSTTCPR